MEYYINLLKIFFSIISTFIIFYYTNLATPCDSNINDGDYFNNNTIMGYLINHKPGYVCPLGVILGKIMIPICIIQIYYLYNNKYEDIKLIHIILLLIGVILSFLNIKLQQNLLILFLLQLFIIIIP